METMICKPCEEMADGTLVHLASIGNEDAFAILMRRYSPPLRQLISSMLQDDQLTHDVLQHVFLKLYLSLTTLQTDMPIQAWLCQVARNRCVDELRRKRPIYFSELEVATREEVEPVVTNIADPAMLIEEIAEKHELQAQIHLAIARLPKKYRIIVFLRYITYEDFAQIGQRLHISESTVKRYIYRALPLLRTALSDG
jgi:RNA polymerase sigma factor (sigma-70 family)